MAERGDCHVCGGQVVVEWTVCTAFSEPFYGDSREQSLDFVNKGGFDLIIGRYVLIHQRDPVSLLRHAARLVKPGGSIAFHEIRLSQKCASVPNVPLSIFQ